MAYEVLTQEEYANSLLNFAYSDPDVIESLLPTDLQVGSLERAEVESLALVLEENDQRVAAGIGQAISQACLQAFGFSLLPPQAATGSIQASAFIAPVADITIPVGWQVQSQNGTSYQTTTTGHIYAGQLSSALIAIVATTPGAIGNTPANTITIPASAIPGVDIITNPYAVNNGEDQETTDQQATRFAEFIKSLPRGTKEALEFAAYSADPSVIQALNTDPFLFNPVPPGVPFAGETCIYYDDGIPSTVLSTGNDPVTAKINQVVFGYTDITGTRVPGYKAAGCFVGIYKCTYANIYVRADITLLPAGYNDLTNIQAELLAAATTYFSQIRIGDPVSYQNLVTLLTDCDQNISQVNLYIWTDGMSIPAYGSAMSAQPITFTPTSIPAFAYGTRGVLFQGPAAGPSGTVNYPEWRFFTSTS